MPAPVDALHVISPAMADLLIASIWQSILLTGLVALCIRYVSGVSAGTRSAIWTAVLVLIVLLPLLSLAMPHTTVGAGRAVHLANDWSLGVVCFWALLSLFRAAQLCVSALRLRALARNAEPVEVDTIAPLLELGSRNVMLCTSEQVDRPSVVGFFRPRILLSPELLSNLSQPELEQIVLHEMEHLRRGDHWTNLLQQISLVLLPWNPAVLWLNRRLCFERELACDDGVMRATNARTRARKMYAACLVRLAEDSMLRRKISLALGILGGFRARESELVTRVRRILTTNETGRVSKSLRAATAAVLAGALGLSVLLARSPRLVDFATTPATVASTSSAEAQSFTPVLARRAAAARPVMVKAVVSGPSGARAIATTAVVHRRTAVRRRTLRAAETAPQMKVPVWRDSRPLARPFITLTSAEDPQKVYAAVPWPGGWLLIQL